MQFVLRTVFWHILESWTLLSLVPRTKVKPMRCRDMLGLNNKIANNQIGSKCATNRRCCEFSGIETKEKRGVMQSKALSNREIAQVSNSSGDWNHMWNTCMYSLENPGEISESWFSWILLEQGL
jgi:hypothetical protein